MAEQSDFAASANEASRPDGSQAQQRDAIAVPRAKADLGKRFVAGIIDAVAAVLVAMIPVVGGLIAAAYWLLRDGLEFDFMDRRSLGKKVMKLRPVRLDGKPMDLETSMRRNWVFALGGVISALLFIPVLGWILAIPVGLASLALGLTELYKVLTDAEGRRLGDSWARTKVIEVDS